MGSRTFTAARLDDEDILASHALLNLDSRLADLELAKEDLCRRDAEVVADGPAPSSVRPDLMLGVSLSIALATANAAAHTQSAAGASSRRGRQCCGP